jgi:thiamine-monophosphate kinase
MSMFAQIRRLSRRPQLSDNVSAAMRALHVSEANEEREPYPDDLKLGTLGERIILSEILLPMLATSKAGVGSIGDDCAELPVPPSGNAVLVTTDPCPSPIVFELEDRDYWHYGRMTILINVSDLAASGATPMGIVVSTVMPNDMFLRDYRRYLAGLIEAANEWDCPIIGGNIKDGPEFTSTGTAIGSAPIGQILRRSGAQEGDKVCVAGKMGMFWAAVLQRLNPTRLKVSSDSDTDLWQALYRPKPRLRESKLLSGSGLVTSCMDASDGVGGCLIELAAKNELDIVIDGRSLIPGRAVAEVADQAGIDARKLMLAWGNWELVFTVAAKSTDKVLNLAQQFDFEVTVIGEMREGNGSVWISSEGKAEELTNFASERFTGTSYFTYGIKSYMQWLINAPLTIKGAL